MWFQQETPPSCTANMCANCEWFSVDQRHAGPCLRQFPLTALWNCLRSDIQTGCWISDIGDHHTTVKLMFVCHSTASHIFQHVMCVLTWLLNNSSQASNNEVIAYNSICVLCTHYRWQTTVNSRWMLTMDDTTEVIWLSLFSAFTKADHML